MTARPCIGARSFTQEKGNQENNVLILRESQAGIINHVVIYLQIATEI